MMDLMGPAIIIKVIFNIVVNIVKICRMVQILNHLWNCGPNFKLTGPLGLANHCCTKWSCKL